MDPNDNIVAMVEDAADHGHTYVIRHDGQDVAVVMPYEEYRRMVEKLGEEN
jgi:prevent-host-death family protein